MTKYHIYILTDQNIDHTSYIYGNQSLYVGVSEKNPYDRLSKRFKLFTHTIEYPRGQYNREDYYIEVYDPNRHVYKYLIKYNKPLHKVIAVDIFFNITDKKNNIPLVLGFHQENKFSSYYTANFLYYYTSGVFVHKVINNNLPVAIFPKNDLLTRLLEELGLYVTDRKEKLVIRLEKKTGSNTKYPDTGHFPKKITLTKHLNYEHFEKYNHSIDNSLYETFVYLTFNNDSLYFDGGHKHKKINSIDAYYCKYYKDEPILFVLKFSNYRNYIYKYSDFRIDAGKSNFVKKHSELREVVDNELLKALIDEFDKTNKTTTYLIYQKTEGYSSRMHIKLDHGTNTKYKKYTHTSSGFAGEYSNILLKNGPFRVGSSSYVDKVTEVTAYFLKNKSGKEDDVPFLIEINPYGTKPSEYYSKSNDFDESWIKLDVNVSLELILDGLEEVIDLDFTEGRKYVYETIGLKSSEEEEDDDDEEEEEEEEEDERQGLRLKDLRELTHSAEGLEHAIRQGHIATISGIGGPPSQEIDSRGKGPVDDRRIETLESSEGQLSTVKPPDQHPEGKPAATRPEHESSPLKPAAAAKPAAAKPAPPLTEKKPDSEPSVIPKEVIRSPVTQFPVSKGPETPKFRDKETQRPTISTTSSTQVSQKLEKTRQEKGKHVKPKTTKEEIPKYVVVIWLDKLHRYQFQDFRVFLSSSGKINIENVLNTKDYVAVNSKNDIWDEFEHDPYRVYEHDFEESLRGASYKPSQVELEFILKVSSAFSVLSLYRPHKIRHPFKLNYKSGKNKVHVYFYKNTITPLLFCYNGFLYRPKSQVDYDKKWSKMSGIKCPCSSSSSFTVELLLQELKKIAEFLKLFERSETQTFEHHSSPQLQAADQSESSVPSVGTIAGASVGSLVGTAAVSGGVTVAFRPELIITSIRALL